MQIVKAPWWSSKKHYVRRRPDYQHPSKGVLANRVRFAQISTRQYGKTGFSKDGMPIIAATVRDELKRLPPLPKEKKKLTFLQRISLYREMKKKGVPFVLLEE